MNNIYLLTTFLLTCVLLGISEGFRKLFIAGILILAALKILGIF